MRVKTKAGMVVMTPAMREARTVAALLGPTYTVENLNPRSKAATEIVMSIRRGYTLIDLCSEWLALNEGRPAEAQYHHPFFSGHDSLKRKIKEAFAVESEYLAARRWADWWPWLFGLWLKGSLERQLEEAALNLPSSLRARLKQA